MTKITKTKITKTKITQAFIFAAGRGERMRPLTDTIPKPLVKINNKSIIDYIIEKLDKISDIKKIIINGFYLAEQIQDHIKELNNDKIIFSYEKAKVETAGGLLFASNLIDFNQPLLCINGDVLWQEQNISDIELLAKNWDEKNHQILLGVKKTSQYLGYDGNLSQGGDFTFNQGKLFRIENQMRNCVFVGLQIINPKILLKAKEEKIGECFSMSHFYNSSVDKNGLLKNIAAVELAGKYFHIGNAASISLAENNL